MGRLVRHFGGGGHTGSRQVQLFLRAVTLGGKRHCGNGGGDQRGKMAGLVVLATTNGHVLSPLSERCPDSLYWLLASGDDLKQGR
ncbi:hypothetical protein D3C78_1686280 [compost metagenome]